MKVTQYTYPNKYLSFQNSKQNCTNHQANNNHKEISEFDRDVFFAYISTIPYRIKTTPEEIEKLKSYNQKKYIKNTFNYVCDKLNYSENIRPNLEFIKHDNVDAYMSYAPMFNKIEINLHKLKGVSKADIYALLRHELEHFKQHTLMLRHETIGIEVINQLTQIYSENYAAMAKNMFERISTKEIKQIYKNNPDYNKILLSKKLFDAGKEQEAINLFIKSNCDGYKNDYLQIRKMVIDEMGLIPENSEMTEKIKEYFSEQYLNYDCVNDDGTINTTIYNNLVIEQEAHLAQLAAELDFNPSECGIRILKQST